MFLLAPCTMSRGALSARWWMAQTGRQTAHELTVISLESDSDPQHVVIVCSANTKHLYDIIQRRPNVDDVGPTLYTCYTNVLCLLSVSIRQVLPPKAIAEWPQSLAGQSHANLHKNRKLPGWLKRQPTNIKNIMIFKIMGVVGIFEQIRLRMTCVYRVNWQMKTIFDLFYFIFWNKTNASFETLLVVMFYRKYTKYVNAR